MPRPPGAFYDARAGCWASSSIGELRTTKDGRFYRTKVRNPALRHPTKDRNAAQNWVLDELRRIEQNLEMAGRIDPTFGQVVEYYLEAIESKIGPETYDRRVEHLLRFKEWPRADDPNRMENRIVKTLTKLDGERFRDAMAESGLSPSYVTDGLIKSVKACLSWATSIEPGRYPGLPLSSNPLAGVVGPLILRRKLRKVDPVALAKFVGWAWRRAVCMTGKINRRHAKTAVILLMTLRDTGARPKDLCVAEWDEFEVMADGWGLITLPPWKWKNGHITGEPRIIAVPPHCVRWIEWIQALPGRHETRIFTHRRGRGLAARGIGTAEAGEPWVKLDLARKRTGDTKMLQQWFGRLREEGSAAGYKLPPGFRLYFNRSYFVTGARRRGANDVALARALGTSVRMLDSNYTDMDESDILEVAKLATRRIPTKTPDGDQ